MRSNSQSGFSLVEIAIVVMIIGLLIAGSLSMIRPYMNMASANLTRKKMENISLSLATFAQTYGRLPCPADPTTSETATNPPYGSPRNSGSGGVNVATNNCGAGITSQIGIVPFKALGLDEEQVKDNYGNLITYAVSAAMTKYNSEVYNSTDVVHEMCRTRTWIDDAVPEKNKNVRKARVCCPNRDSNDIQLKNLRTGGINLFTGVHSNNASDYGDPDSVVTVQPTPENQLIAFILVSHGHNGEGSYIEHTNKTRQVFAPANSEESENRDHTDLKFVSAKTSNTNDNHFFDDIIVWKTNDQLISAFGNDSCGRP